MRSHARWSGFLCGLLASLGCGDNAAQCGEGTIAEDGFCLPGEPPPPTCTGGTVLDEVSGTCVLDDSVCQDGTVLINLQCQDPTAGLTVDVIEGNEPNGFGIGGETSATPAGQVTLAAAGAPGVILKGNLAPRADRDADGFPEPDYDTYVLDVAGPTLLDVSADGVQGLVGGFRVESEVDELAGWIRLGVALTSDTARRQLYLPAAGRYLVAVADTRSLVFDAPIGDASTDYYVTLARLDIPAAEQLTATSDLVVVTGLLDPVAPRLYAVPVGRALEELVLATDDPDVTGSVSLLVAGGFRGSADEDKRGAVPVPATVVISGLDPAELALVVVDHVVALATQPVPFELELRLDALGALGAATKVTQP